VGHLDQEVDKGAGLGGEEAAAAKHRVDLVVAILVGKPCWLSV
jgi:hypothetical protein